MLNSRLCSSSIWRRPLSISGASRRRMPMLIRMRGSRAYSRVHVVALFVGDHLQRQLVVVAQEDAPLALSAEISGVWAMISTIGVRTSSRDRHEDARHQREVERHVALVAVAEVRPHVGRPLVRLGQQHAVRVVRVDRRRGPRAGTRGSRAGSRSSCPRARTGTARRPGGSRRRPRSSQKRSAVDHLARGPRGCRSSGRAGG